MEYILKGFLNYFVRYDISIIYLKRVRIECIRREIRKGVVLYVICDFGKELFFGWAYILVGIRY